MTASIAASGDASDPIIVEELPDGWKTAWVTYKTSGGELRRSIQIIDLRSEPPMQYFHDSLRTISGKCALLVLGIPFLAVANMTFNLLRIVVLEISTFGRAAQSIVTIRNLNDAGRIIVDYTRDASEIFLKGSWDFVRLPFLALEMQFCCLYGIIFPLEGRALAGNAERSLRGSDRSHDLRRFTDPNPALFDIFTNKDSQYCFFWALCFQRIGPAGIKGNVLGVDYLTPGTVVP